MDDSAVSRASQSKDHNNNNSKNNSSNSNKPMPIMIPVCLRLLKNDNKDNDAADPAERSTALRCGRHNNNCQEEEEYRRATKLQLVDGHDLTGLGGLEQFTVLGIPIASKPWCCWVRMNTMMMSQRKWRP
jgi:hypothetical protein